MASRRKEKDEDKKYSELEGRTKKIEEFLGGIFGNSMEIENTQFLLAKLRVAEQRFLMGEQSRQIFLQFLNETKQEEAFNDWFNKKRAEEVEKAKAQAEAPSQPPVEPQGKTIEELKKKRIEELEKSEQPADETKK